jgi:hypothetical protein
MPASRDDLAVRVRYRRHRDESLVSAPAGWAVRSAQDRSLTSPPLARRAQQPAGACEVRHEPISYVPP